MLRYTFDYHRPGRALTMCSYPYIAHSILSLKSQIDSKLKIHIDISGQVTMKMAILAILLIFAGGCLTKQDGGSAQNDSALIQPIPTVSGTQELLLNEQDLQQLGMTSDLNEQDLQQLGLSNGTNCRTEEGYTNIVDSSPGQYSICIYTINSLNDTQVIIELQKFTNIEALNGAYQYDSSHLYSIEGLISENDYGDKSRFRVNNEHDYGGQYNEPNIYYYHLWICKDLYLIHITSKGSKEAGEYIAKIGWRILSKFR